MNSKFIVKLAMTTAFVAVPSVGWTSLGISSTLSASSTDVGLKKAPGWARTAEKAAVKGKFDKALTYAEMAVEADMNNREYRALLARIYMAQGRFQSAERTLMDVVELGQVDPRTVISLALSRIAQGKVDSAIALVEANRDIVPASDYGLTLALAGQTKQAVQVLTDAIRADNATARTRQNLALAYALDGRWREARIMAVQDMPEETVNQRVAEWAQYARPGAYEMRVAGLLRVTPTSDSGQPARLALNSVPNALAQADVSETSPVNVAAMAPVQELPAVGAVPVSESAGFSVDEHNMQLASVTPIAPIEAPLIAAPVGPAKSVSNGKPVKLALAPEAAGKVNIGGSHLVQLGAFSSATNASKAWSNLRERYGVLSGFSSASSVVKVNGKSLVRLAASGFGNKASADAVCQEIKSRGGVCIVRSVSGGSPVRMAAGQGRVVAAR
jgi:D-alanyl-D-alanine carboxypeptidase